MSTFRWLHWENLWNEQQVGCWTVKVAGGTQTSYSKKYSEIDQVHLSTVAYDFAGRNQWWIENIFAKWFGYDECTCWGNTHSIRSRTVGTAGQPEWIAACYCGAVSSRLWRLFSVQWLGWENQGRRSELIWLDGNVDQHQLCLSHQCCVDLHHTIGPSVELLSRCQITV